MTYYHGTCTVNKVRINAIDAQAQVAIGTMDSRRRAMILPLRHDLVALWTSRPRIGRPARAAARSSWYYLPHEARPRRRRDLPRLPDRGRECGRRRAGRRGRPDGDGPGQRPVRAPGPEHGRPGAE